MIRFLADENFDGDLLRILHRRHWNFDVERAQDTELKSRSDSVVLAWAADQRRVVLTHDVNTMTAEAYGRLRRGEPMRGLFVVPQLAPAGPVLASLELLNEASDTDEWDGQVVYLPYR